MSFRQYRAATDMERYGSAAITMGRELRKKGLRVPGHCGYCGGAGKFRYPGGPDTWAKPFLCGPCAGTGLSEVASFADAMGIGIAPSNRTRAVAS